MTRFVILGLLREGPPKWAFVLAKEYEQRTGSAVQPANVRRDLGELEKRGFVAPVSLQPGEDERRKPYRITEAGCRRFEGWLQSPEAVQGGSFDDWLLFMERVPMPARQQLIERRADLVWFEMKKRQRTYDDMNARSEAQHATHFKADTWVLLLSIRRYAAELESVQELLERVKNGKRETRP